MTIDMIQHQGDDDIVGMAANLTSLGVPPEPSKSQ